MADERVKLLDQDEQLVFATIAAIGIETSTRLEATGEPDDIAAAERARQAAAEIVEGLLEKAAQRSSTE